MDMHKVSAREMEDPRERFEGWVYLKGPFTDEEEIRVEAMIWPDGIVDLDSKYYIGPLSEEVEIPGRCVNMLAAIDDLVLDAWKKRKAREREEACK